MTADDGQGAEDPRHAVARMLLKHQIESDYAGLWGTYAPAGAKGIVLTGPLHGLPPDNPDAIAAAQWAVEAGLFQAGEGLQIVSWTELIQKHRDATAARWTGKLNRRAAPVPMPCAPEMQRLASLAHDGPTQANMTADKGRVTHAPGGPGITYFAQAESAESLTGDAGPLGLLEVPTLRPADFFAVVYALQRLVQVGQAEGQVVISADELLDLHAGGKKRRHTAEERRALVEGFYRSLMIARKWTLWGSRSWINSKTKRRETIHFESPVIGDVRPFYRGEVPPPGSGTSADGVIVSDSPLTKIYRADPSMLQGIGRLGAIASIPTGRPSGDWARCLALAISALARMNAARVGSRLTYSRRTLLYQFRPEHDPQGYLDSPSPGRVRTFWRDAVDILKEQGIVAGIDEPPAPVSRQGWTETWLDEMVTVHLAGEWGTRAERLLEGQKQRETVKPGRGGPRKSGAGKGPPRPGEKSP